MSYQTDTITILTDMLNLHVNKSAFREVIKQIIDSYSNKYQLANGKYLVMWWSCLAKKYIKLTKEHLLITKSALEILNKNLSVPQYKKLLRFEHMTPVAYTKRKLFKLDTITESNVEECFKYSTVVLMLKEESQFLDTHIITETDIINFESEIKGKLNYVDTDTWVGHRANFYGDGLFRLFLLVNSGTALTKAGIEVSNPLEYYRLHYNNFKLY